MFLVILLLLDIGCLSIGFEFNILKDKVNLIIIVRTVMKTFQFNVSFVLFLWTIYVCRNLKRSLEGNDQFAQLRQQINRFFTVVLIILTMRTIVQLTVYVLWCLSMTGAISWHYITSWPFLVWWTYFESSCEAFLNYFLIHHLFKNSNV